MQIYQQLVLETGVWRCRRCKHTKNLFWKLVFGDAGDANLRKTCFVNWFLAMPAMQIYENLVLETGFWRCRRCKSTTNLFWKLVLGDAGNANLRKTCFENCFSLCWRCTSTKNLFRRLVFGDAGDANLRKTSFGNCFLAMPAMQIYETLVLESYINPYHGTCDPVGIISGASFLGSRRVDFALLFGTF